MSKIVYSFTKKFDKQISGILPEIFAYFFFAEKIVRNLSFSWIYYVNMFLLTAVKLKLKKTIVALFS